MKNIFKTLALSAFAALLSPPLTASAEETQHQKHFESTLKQTGNYVLFERMSPKSCKIDITLTYPNGKTQSMNASCSTLYALGRANGAREFVFYSKNRIITLIAPPGGRVKESGTFWTVTGALMTEGKDTTNWKTPGSCLMKTPENRETGSMTCVTNDKKVRLTMMIPQITHTTNLLN